MKITIFGKGHMGMAIGKRFESATNSINFYTSGDEVTELGDLIILAVPYGALKGIAQNYKKDFSGKTVIDISNPVNFTTWDSLVVPAGTSSAEELQKMLPDSKVLKAFNTTFAATLESGKVGDIQTTVLVAGDDEQSKDTLKEALKDSKLGLINVGKLKMARELEATGFLQMTIANNGNISWTGGFGVIK